MAPTVPLSLMIPGGGFHYLNHNQKIFEIGFNSQYSILTWGLASCGDLSHRSQIAQLADKLKKKPPSSVKEVATGWVDHFWSNYTNRFANEIRTLKDLDAKKPHVAVATASADMRTKAEETAHSQLKFGLVVGFCVAGVHATDRLPAAFEIIFDPLAPKPVPIGVDMNATRCWGAPKVFNRIVHGIDDEIKQSILNSPKWIGTDDELNALVSTQKLYLPQLPMRDAVDFVHSCIQSTIKTLKFSHLSQTCGGPIEIAVVTSDREFRWVRHKEWDVAIKEGHGLWKE